MRQEQLARERLAQLRSRRKAKEEETEDKLVTDGDVGVLQEAVMKALEHKHQDERQVVKIFKPNVCPENCLVAKIFEFIST